MYFKTIAISGMELPVTIVNGFQPLTTATRISNPESKSTQPTQDNMKTLCWEERPEKQTYSWKEELSFLPEGQWVAAESQREMTQDKVKLICQSGTPSKTGIYLTGRVELFTGQWVS